jgi:hypothetical protein
MTKVGIVDHPLLVEVVRLSSIPSRSSAVLPGADGLPADGLLPDSVSAPVHAPRRGTDPRPTATAMVLRIRRMKHPLR